MKTSRHVTSNDFDKKEIKFYANVSKTDPIARLLFFFSNGDCTCVRYLSEKNIQVCVTCM